ncbi:hypothetical protein L3V82_01160 [Thiotrichales bacterium 19S3-7]|nr:hypothetical protein [Thiotrichales bacterium 19S3-7]MCF6800770.1 hypothetical protein [Thiotrichales bacterium 19S3-11]
MSKVRYLITYFVLVAISLACVLIIYIEKNDRMQITTSSSAYANYLAYDYVQQA